jgi:potassium-dependent mechanosensitive channel
MHFVHKLTAASLLAMSLSLGAVAAPDLLGGSLSATEETASATEPTQPAEISKRTEELARERSALALELQAADSPISGHLNSVDEKLAQIELQLKAQADLAEALARPPRATADQLPTIEPSVSLLNALYEQLDSAESALREKRSNLDTAKQQLQRLETRAREARAKLDSSPANNQARNQRALRLAELNARLQQERVNLATLESRAAQAAAARDGSLEQQIAGVRAGLARGEGDVQDSIGTLIEREASLQRSKSLAERQLAIVELRLAAAKQRYAEDPGAPADLLAVVEALTAYRDVLGKQITLSTSELERVTALRAIWRSWEALLRSSYTAEELASWEQQANDQLNDLKLTAALRQGQEADLQIRLENLEARINQMPAESAARTSLQETREALNELHTQLLAADRQLAADQRLTRRFSDDVIALTGHVSFLGYISRAAQTLWQLWNYEITTIDDAPFTVGSLTMGLLLFAVGLWASRLGAAAMGRVAAQRLKLDAGAAQAMQTFSFYAMLAGFTLLALRAVHFPLTAFTFLGGALAIGIGFGSQNVMNNFISGLILMLERPVRAQDVVEVDGSHGVIQKIGPRSTQIRATDGRHIVVPNSFFLESNVVNWTLSDELIRTKVSVGVSYGSPTRLVQQLIEEVIKQEPLALSTPAPKVIFDAFGDNSLNFDVYFWVEARSPMSVASVQSKVRFRIDDVFREHHLVIAFPQRDVHLDASAPIEVRVTGGDLSGAGAAAPPEKS